MQKCHKKKKTAQKFSTTKKRRGRTYRQKKKRIENKETRERVWVAYRGDARASPLIKQPLERRRESGPVGKSY